jgi:hypothetical protein
MSKTRKVVSTTMYLLHEWCFCIDYSLFLENSMDFFATPIGVNDMLQDGLYDHTIKRSVLKGNIMRITYQHGA